MSNVRLRGHHLLCLPRFRGLGYSKEFTANMTLIAKSLSAEPWQIVQLLDEPDDICRQCPHLEDTGACALEEQIPVRERDGIVLEKLGVRPGERLPYLELADRLAAVADSFLSEKACAGCRWQNFCISLPES
ncbi:MAG: DUF1284 domain-containing protein [Dethiobacter sp.]